jgi:hypothetical protein
MTLSHPACHSSRSARHPARVPVKGVILRRAERKSAAGGSTPQDGSRE